MATIQIRNIPEDAYEVIQQRASAAGQSIQAYMRAQVIEMAARPNKAEALQRVRKSIRRTGGLGLAPDDIVEIIHGARRAQ